METALQRFKADFFRALAHPARIRVLEILVAGERTVQQLQAGLGLDQSSVSQHLAVLRKQNIVAARKTGTTVRYTLRDPLIGQLLATAREIFDRQLVGTQVLLRELRREGRAK
jgi:DNA-binding transcriptional ArsR family regulator